MRLFFLFVAIVAAGSSVAAPNEWQSIHPTGPTQSLGGYVKHSAVAPDGAQYLVSSFDNLYTRESAATPWVRVPATQPQRLRNFIFNAPDSQTIVANVGTGSVARSTDGGLTWTTIYRAVLDGPWIELRGAGPSNPNLLFAWPHTANEIFTSIDGGDTWAGQPTADMDDLRELVIDPTDPDILYGLDTQRVKKSTDGGITWEVREEGLGTYWYMDVIVMHPQDTQTLFAGAGSQSRIHKTIDGAISWTQIGVPNSLFTGRITDLAVDQADPDKLYAATQEGGVLVTANGGVNWSRIADGKEDGEWIDIHTLSDGTALYTGESGTAVVDSAGSFTRSNQGFSDFPMDSFACADPACEQRYTGSFQTGFARLPAGASNWQIERGEFAEVVHEIAVDPNDGDHVFVAAETGLFESFDAGDTWNQIFIPGAGYARDVSLSPESADVMFVQTFLGLMNTFDGGLNWNLSLGPEFFWACCDTFPVEVSPLDNQIINMGTYADGLFTSFDGGVNWINTTDIFHTSGVSALTTDPRNPAIVYLAESWDHVWRSNDSGASWTEIGNTGLPSFTQTRKLIVDPFVDGRVYLLPNSGTLYVYDPKQDSWEAYGDPARGCQYTCRLQLDHTRQGRLLATIGGELFEMNLDTDLDAVIESQDNCTFEANSPQRDTDGDGYGNRCDPDLNNDLIVNFLDLAIFAERFLSADADADFNGDDAVNFLDLDIFRDFFLKAPGPNAAGTF